MSLEDVIAGAIEDAREDGLEGEQAGDEPTLDAGDEGTGGDESGENTGDEGTGDENTGEGDEKDGETGKGDENADEKPAEGDEKLEDGEKGEKKDDALDPNSEEALLKEFGLKPRADGRVHRLPLPRVAKILASRLEKPTAALSGVITTVGKALGLSDDEVKTATAETIGPKVVEALSEVTEMRDRISVMDELAPIMLTNGDAFITMLANSKPELYGKFLAVLQDGYQPPTGEKLPDEKDDPKPLPDMPVTLADGTKGKTYSHEQHEKLLAWQERKSERKFNAALEARFKPLDDANKAAQTQHARQQRVVDDLNDFMSEAHEWSGFKDAKDAILAATKLVDKKIPFRRAVRMAYETVVFGKLHTDRTKMRAEILAELKKAPPSTSTAKKGGVVNPKKEETERGDDGQPVDGLEGAIRRALRQARASGTIK